MTEDKLVYFGTLMATGDYKRTAELLHLWRWSGITSDELIDLRNGLEECLNEIRQQL